MTTKVFISYRRDDTRHVAGRLADRLDEHFQVFMDIDTIEPGMAFDEVVRRAVAECDVLLAMIGNQWATLTDDSGARRLDDPQDWVAEELRVALQRGIRVIPILVDGARPPAAAILPPALQSLATRQALPLRHESFASDSAHLVASIERVAQEVERNRPPPTTRTGESAGGSRVDDEALYADPDYGSAVVAILAEHWAEAIGHLTKVEQRFPDHQIVSERLAQARRQQNLVDLDGQAALAAAQARWSEAITALREILATDPSYKDAEQRLRNAERRGRATQLRADLRGLHAAQQWEGVLAAAAELKQLDPGFDDPQGWVEEAHRALAENTLSRKYAAGLAQLDQQNWSSAYQVFSAIGNERPGYRDSDQLRDRAQQQLQWAGWQTPGVVQTPAAGQPPETPRKTQDSERTAPPAPPEEPPRGLAPPAGAKQASRARRRLVAVLVVLTVILLVLIVVLVLAVLNRQAPGAGAPQGNPATTGAVQSGSNGSAGGSEPVTDRAVLLSHVPADLREHCKSATDPGTRSGLLAALDCGSSSGAPSGTPEHAEYYLFSSAEKVRAAYEVRAGEYTLVDGDCSGLYQQGRYVSPSTGSSGVRGCYETGNGFVVIRWTDDNLAVLVSAYDQDLSLAELREWAEAHAPVA